MAGLPACCPGLGLQQLGTSWGQGRARVQTPWRVVPAFSHHSQAPASTWLFPKAAPEQPPRRCGRSPTQRLSGASAARASPLPSVVSLLSAALLPHSRAQRAPRRVPCLTSEGPKAGLGPKGRNTPSPLSFQTFALPLFPTTEPAKTQSPSPHRHPRLGQGRMGSGLRRRGVSRLQGGVWGLFLAGSRTTLTCPHAAPTLWFSRPPSYRCQPGHDPLTWGSPGWPGGPWALGSHVIWAVMPFSSKLPRNKDTARFGNNTSPLLQSVKGQDSRVAAQPGSGHPSPPPPRPRPLLGVQTHASRPGGGARARGRASGRVAGTPRMLHTRRRG